MRELLEKLSTLRPKQWEFSSDDIAGIRKYWDTKKKRSNIPGNSSAIRKYTKEIERWLTALHDDFAFNRGMFTYASETDAAVEGLKNRRLRMLNNIKKTIAPFRSADASFDSFDSGVSDSMSVFYQADLDDLFYKELRIAFDKAQKYMDGVIKGLTWLMRPTKRVGETIDMDFSLGRAKFIFRDVPTSSTMVNSLGVQGSWRGGLARSRKIYVQEFKRAQNILKRRGLDFLWYGKFFVECRTCGGDATMKGFGRVAATYYPTKDYVKIFSDPGLGVAATIVHELGHRLWFRFMSKQDRGRFAEYFGKVNPVSGYGGTNAEEDFAEVFKDYIDGKNLDRDQLERFKSFARVKGRKIRDDVHDRLDLLCAV